MDDIAIESSPSPSSPASIAPPGSSQQNPSPPVPAQASFTPPDSFTVSPGPLSNLTTNPSGNAPLQQNLPVDEGDPSKQLQSTVPSAPEVTDAQERFETELEFVQCLASPSYIQWLAQNQYFEDPDFIAYLSYLQYWQEPPYIQFVIFPHCLYFLKLLQKKVFREAFKRQDYTLFVHQQQGYYWQFRRTMKPRKEGDSKGTNGVNETENEISNANGVGTAEGAGNVIPQVDAAEAMQI